VLVDTGRRFLQVSAGSSHTCGVATDNRAFCWGLGSAGQIGDNQLLTRRTPRAVAGGLRFSQVITEQTLSSGGSTCAITTDKRGYCWGSNDFGQLGDGTTTQRQKPTPVSGGIAFTSLSAGQGHTCGSSVGGVGYCWGLNYYGALGDGGPLGNLAATHLTPSVVTGAHAFASVATGKDHSCGVATNGGAWCWGGNSAGQLGNGTPDFASSTPGPVSAPE
jgi:alpha-tubulin suppressor-like RCC1 family protein